MHENVGIYIGKNDQAIKAIFLGSSFQSLNGQSFEESVVKRLNASGCLMGWSIELGKFNIEYLPRHAKKGQALVDFLAKFVDFP